MQSPMRSTSFARFLFQYRKRYGLHAILSFHTGIRSLRVSIPQAVWIACNFQFPRVSYNAATFQYRKRYGLHAIIGHAPSNEHRSVSIPQAVWIACNVESDVSHPGWCGFNTASGMDCMQFSCGDAPLHEIGVSIPQAVWIACNFLFLKGSDQMNTVSIPQAVWIACNLDEWYPLLPTERVSIPQAVWIACNEKNFLVSQAFPCFNTASGMDCMQSRTPLSPPFMQGFNTASGMDCMQWQDLRSGIPRANCFNTASGMDCMQYCLPEALETVSPKTEFLTMTPFSRFFPK